MTDPKIMIPIIRKAVPSLVAQQIVGVQPMPSSSIFGPYYGDWEKFFAWTPVKIKGKYVWLKSAYRREEQRVILVTHVTKQFLWFTYTNKIRPKKIYDYGDLFDVLGT
jgi:hypothetical protein